MMRWELKFSKENHFSTEIQEMSSAKLNGTDNNHNQLIYSTSFWEFAWKIAIKIRIKTVWMNFNWAAMCITPNK